MKVDMACSLIYLQTQAGLIITRSKQTVRVAASSRLMRRRDLSAQPPMLLDGRLAILAAEEAKLGKTGTDCWHRWSESYCYGYFLKSPPARRVARYQRR
jgi:hypothetical protein